MATVDDALTLVQTLKQREGRAAGTLDMYRVKSRPICAVLGGDTELDTLTAADVDEYIETRREDVSDHTISKELSVLEEALKAAYKRDLMLRDPGKIMPERFSPKYEPRTAFLPEEQWPALLDGFAADRAAHIAYCIATGSNMSESVAARREFIDTANSTVFINGTKRATRKRSVPINAVNDRLIARVLRDAPGKVGEPLFRPWDHFNRDLASRCEKLGLPRLSSNDLRRTYGSILVQRGVPFDLVAKLMGHSSTAMVLRVYGQLRPQHMKSLVDQYVGGPA